MSLSRNMVRAARALTMDHLPPEVIAKVKIGLLDFLSCAFEARDLPWGCQAIRMASAATGQATVIGTPVKTSPAEAAFANATLGHGLVREDMHTGAVSHLGVVIFPTLLALAQRQRARGRDFILGAVCGYEIGASVGRAIMDQEMVRRFRPTGITGPLAGAMAGSRLLALDEDATVGALGFAANATGGLNEWPYCGGDEMFFHPGFAARNAVTAVELLKPRSSSVGKRARRPRRAFCGPQQAGSHRAGRTIFQWDVRDSFCVLQAGARVQLRADGLPGRARSEHAGWLSEQRH